MESHNSSALTKLRYGFSALIAMLLVLVTAAFLSFQQMQEANRWSIHTYQVLVETHAMGESLINIDTGARGFAISGEDRFLQPLTKGQAAFLLHWKEARRLTADRASQQERLRKLQATYQQWTQATLKPLLAKRRATPSSQPLIDRAGRMNASKRDTDTMRALLEQINNTEATLLQQRTQRAAQFQWWTQATLASAGVLAVLLGVVLTTLLIRNMRRLADTNAELHSEIEERRQAQEALQEAKEEAERARADAERANHAKSEFLSRMSHELRTPLNAILGFGQVLEMEELEAEQQRSVRHIVKGGRHLLDLINEVLDIARIESGQMQLSLEPVPVPDVLDEVLALVRPLAEHRQIYLDQPGGNDDERDTLYVLADRQRLKQVLLNLLANAIKYNRDAGHVTVSFAVSQATAGQLIEPNGSSRTEISDWLRIEVSDTGPGIAEEKIERLFMPFDRLDAEKTRVEGTGLGLALSQRLVQAMNGRIGVTSTPGQGSTFWFELPLTHSPIPHSVRSNEQRAAGAVEAPTHTVLYVEDNLSNLELLQRLLEKRPGIQLLTAMQGRVGLALAIEHQPDLILLDIHLPDLPGHEVLLRLQADPTTRGIPVVILSADATPGQIQRLLSSGAHDYLTKPLDVRKFLEVLDQNLKLATRSVT